MKRRVAIFRHDLLPLSETFIRSQAQALREWQPILLGYRRTPDGLSLDGLDHHLIAHQNGIIQRISGATRFWLHSPDHSAVSALRNLNVSLVHAHFGTDATIIWPSVKAAGLPMLVTLHGFDINIHREWWESGHGGLRGRVYPRRLLEMAQDPAVHFIAVSNAVKECAIKYGIPENKVTVSYIGVDTDRFQPAGLPIEKRKNRILFVGRMVEKKAPLIMIYAHSKIFDEIPDAELVMIGSGPLLPAAKQLASRLGSNVTFLGACNSDQVLSELHKARIFCLPSITSENGDAEGLPISILEAMSCGVPTITSARGAADAIQNRTNGVLTKEGSISDLSINAVKILKDISLSTSLSRTAASTINQRFDIKHCTHSLQGIYNAHSH